MADAAELPLLPRSLLSHVADEREQRALLPRYEALVERARTLRPELGSTEEHELVQDLVVLSLGVIGRLGHRAIEYLRSDVQAQLDALIRDELSSADTTRKLALRHLQKSVEVVGTLIELLGDFYRELPEATVRELIREATEPIDAEVVDDFLEDLDDEWRGLLAWWLSLSVALECTRGALDDLTYWSRRAIEGSRRMEAWLPRFTSDLRASRVELRARWAWTDWDEQDIEDELRAWRDLSE